MESPRLTAGEDVNTFYSCTVNQKSWEVDELQHGSFTHTLLAGLRLQRETNCATVERLNQYLLNQVPQLNARYGKPQQDPYMKAEPPYKINFILLEQSATLKDVEPLKYQASLAENEGNLLLAEQLWIRILAVSRGDLDAIAAIKRIAVKTRPQDSPQKSVISTPESATPSRGEERETSETAIQREEQHQQNLEQYQQSFSQAVEQKFPLNEPSRRKLRNLQQSLQLTEEEVSQIEQPIIAQKEAEERKRREEERIRQQQEAERLQRQREEAERLRQQQEIQRRRRQEEAVTTPVTISRKQFLKWAGLGSAGLLTAVVAREIFKAPTSNFVAELDSFKFEGETITTDLANYRGTDREYEGKVYPGIYADEAKGKYREETTAVGIFPPNAFGLYDMHGQVWEWCEDDFHENYRGAPIDGSAWLSQQSSKKVLRGGSWDDLPRSCRSAYRGGSILTPRTATTVFVWPLVARGLSPLLSLPSCPLRAQKSLILCY